jgi:hypothetical protein
MWQVSYAPWMRVDSVSVLGANASLKKEIIELVQDKLSGAHAYIFSKRNIFLVQKRTIESAIIHKFPLIRKVRISANSMRSLSVSVVEREPDAILCRSKSTKCFFVDNEGFVFAEAPQFAGASFVRYEAKLVDNPIGKYFLSSLGGFSELHSFVKSLNSLNLLPKTVSLEGESYSITVLTLKREVRIIVGRTISFQQSYKNLEAVLQDSKFSLQSVSSIDLRFGNKIFFREEESAL